jgi:RND superfamily putative drug exporter
MASRLYALGGFSYRRRRLVAVLWLLVLVALGAGAGALKGEYSTQFTIPGTESQQAIDTLQSRFPQAGLDAATANVVLAAPKGRTVAEYKTAVASLLAEAKKGPHVVSVADPFALQAVSKDGRIAVARVTYDIGQAGISAKEQEPLFATAKIGEDAGLRVEFSGSAAEVKSPPGGIDELLGVVVAALVLFMMFSSLIAVGIPLLTAVFGVALGGAGVTAMSGFVSLSATTPILGVMLGLAVGIDYALLIMTRFRDELQKGRTGEEAAARAVATSGGAVVFAGLTIIVALVGLLTVRIPFISYMGVAAAFTILLAVLVALTLLPALLGFSGTRILGRSKRVASTKQTLGHRWASFVARRPGTVLVAALLGLGILAAPALSLQTSLPDEGTQPLASTNRQAYDLLSEAFGPGSNGPLVVVVETKANGQAAAAKVRAGLLDIKGVVAVQPPVANAKADTFLLAVIPSASPASPETKALVSRIRTAAEGLEPTTGTEIKVSGHTAVQVDVSDRLAGALPVYLAVVVGLALVLLTIVFRSVLVPVKAALGFLLSMAATFGAVVAIFQWGWFGLATPAPVLAILPIFMIGVIFGLAMDYEVFLVTRMREEHVHGAAATDAVVDGFRHSSRVVSAAAVIMISVFSSFMLSPDTSTKLFGFAFAFGIAVDAFVVRMTVVPAVMVLLGERAWAMPAWLERFVPRVDIEGEGLRVLDEAEAMTHDSAAVVD